MILTIVFIASILLIVVHNRRKLLHNRNRKEAKYVEVTPDQEVRVSRGSMVDGLGQEESEV